MAISFVAASAIVTGSNPTVAIPAGVVENDFLVIIYRGTATPATPAGWTSRAAQGAGNFLTIFYRFAGATNASQALSVASATARTVMLAYRGVSATDTISTFTNAASVTTATTPTFNTTYDNEFVISVYGANNVASTAWTAPASTTTRSSIIANANFGGLLVVDELKTTAGATTSRTATITGAHTLSSVAFSIIPGGDHYWVGGTGTWNTTSTTPWSFTSGGASGAPPPGPVDSVFFDQAGAYGVTLTGALVCGNITTSGGPVTFTSTGTLTSSSSMLLDAGTVWNATGAMTFSSISSGKTITTNGVTINAPVTFDGVAGAWSLGSALSTGVTLTTTLTNGTLNLNGFDLTTGIFASTGTAARAITFGTNNIVLAHTTAAQTVLSFATATGFTYTGTGGFRSDASVTRTYVFGTTGGSATNAPNLTLTGSGTAIATLTTGSWFDNLDFGSTAFNPGTTSLNIAGNLTLSSGGTFTAVTPTMVGTGTITSNGRTLAGLIINSTSGTTTFGDAPTLVTNSTVTLTSGALVLNGFDLTTGIFSSSAATTRSIAFGSNNIVLAHTTAAQTVLNMATATGFSFTGTGGFRSDASVTRTYVFGTTGGSATIAPNLSLTGSGTAVQTFTTASWFDNLDFGTTAFAIPATALNIAGSLTLSSGGTFTGLSAAMIGTDSRTITPNGKTIAAFSVNIGAGTLTLAGALGVTTYTQTSGTVDFATFNLTGSGAAAYTAGTLNNIGTITCTTWTVTGAFSLTQGTLTPSTSFVLTSGSFTYGPGGTLSAVPTFTHTAGTVTLNQAYALTVTGTYTLTAGTLTLGGNLSTGIFSSAIAGVRVINFSTFDITLTHTTAAQTVLNMAVATSFSYTGTGNFISDAAVTRTYVFGTTGGTSVNAPNLSLTGSGTGIATITTGSWFGVLDFGTTAFAIPATAINVDSISLSSSGTYTSLGVTMRGDGTFTPNGKTIAAFAVNHAGTTTLAAALGVTTYTQTAGTIDFATFNLTCSGAVAYTAGTLNNIGTITCTTWTVTGAFTFGQGTITPSTSFVLTSGSFTYNSGATLSAVPTFTHTAGTVTLNQNYSLTSTGVYTLTAGTLNMIDRNLTAARFITSGTGVRAINFGTSGNGEITVIGNNATIWDGGSTGITYTGNPRIVATYTGAVGTRTVNLGTAWTEATAFDVTMQPGSSSSVYGFQIINGSTDIIALSGVAENVSLTGFLFTFTPGVMTVYGDYTIDASGGTVSASASLTTFATTSSKNISISRSIDFPITFSGVGGTFNITASLTTGATRAMTLTAGSLVLDGSSSISTGTFLSTGTGTRSINFNNNNITLTNTTAATTVLSMADATNFTIAGTGGFVSDLGVTKTFSFGSTAGGATTNAPNLTFTTGAAIPTITTGSWFNSLNFGSTTSTPAATSIFVSTLTLASGGTYTGLTPTFTSTQTWTPQFSKQLAAIGVNIPGGTLTLGGTQSLVGTTNSTLTAGTLDLGGYDLNAGNFASSNTNTRSIVFGSNNITIAGSTGFVLSMATATNFTLTTSGGGFVSNLAVARSFQFGSTAGGSVTNAPNLAITSGAAIPTITTDSWFNALDFTGTTATPAATTVFVSTLTLATGGTYTAFTPIFTRTQTWTTQFSKELGGIGFNLAGGTLTLGDSPAIVDNGTTTLTAGTLDLNGFNIGTGIFSSSNTNTRSIAFGSNSILCTSHTTAATTVLNMAIATGFTWTGTGKFFVDAAITRTAVFGTTGGTATSAPNLTVSGTGTAIVTLTTGSWFKDLSFGTTAFALPATTLNIAGDLTLSSGGTFASLTLNTVGTGSILSNGKTIAAFTINSVSGTTTLGDALSLVATGTTTLTSGALVLNNFTLATGIFSSSNTNTRSIEFGTGNIVLSTTTLALVNLSMATATNFTYTSSGTYGSGTGVFQSTMSVTRTFTFGTTGGSAANAPRLYLVSGASIPTITTGSWFNEIDFGTTAFTIAATNLNLSSLKSNLSTSVLTALTATMVGTGSIRTNTSIGPLVINTSAITTTLAGTTLCTTAALTQGTLDLASNTLTCSSTFTYNGGSLLTASSILNCTTFTVNGPAFDFTTGTITPSTSFVLTSGSFTLNGGTLSAVPAFTHTAGTVTFNTSYALTATGTYTFTAGTLSLPDGVTLSTGIFSSTNTNTRSIAFGATTAGYISLTHTTAATTRLSMAIATGFTESGPGGFTSSMGVTATFTFGTTGGSSSNAPILLITGGAAIPTFTTGSWFNLLDFTGNTSTPAATVLNLNALTLAVGGTYTALSATMVGTGSILSNGKTIAAFTINSTSGTTTLGDALALIATGTSTLTSGTLDLNGFDLTTGIFSSSVATARSIVFGTNNIILSHTTLATTVLSMATATGFTYTGTGGFSTTMSVTRTFTFGTTGGSYINAPNLAITSGASIPTITTGSWFNLLDFTGSTSTPAATVLNLNALTLAAGGTYTALGATMRGTGTITPNGKTIAAFTVNNDTGTVTLAAALGVTTYTQTAGTIDFATFNLTCSGAAAYTSGTLNNIGTISCTTWTVTGAFTFGQGTITPSTSFVLTSGSFTYNVGATLSAVPTFTHTSGTVSLEKNYSLTATGTYTFTAGTLTLGGDLTTGIFSSTTAAYRVISFGANNIILSHTTAAQTVLNMANQANFTYTGTGGFTSPMSVTRTFTSGNTAPINGSALFSNANYLQLPTNSVNQFGTNNFTIECWVYLNSAVTAANRLIWYNYTPTFTTNSIFFGGHVSYGGRITFWAYNANAAAPLLQDPTVLTSGVWTHLAVVRDGSNFTLYRNGVSVSTATSTASIVDNSYTFGGYIGTSGTTSINGYLSNFRIVNGVAVYTGNFTPPTSPLTATQSAGTNISAITGTQTTLLLNTPNNGFFIADSSVNNLTLTNTGTVTANALTPMTVLPAAGQPVNLALTSGASVPTLTTGSNYNILDFTGSSTTPPATSLNIAGDLTLSSGGTFSAVTPTMVGTGTITSNGKTIAALIVNTTGTATLADALTASGALTLTQGTLDCSTFSVTSATFASTGTLTRSMSGSGTYTITGAGATAFSNASAAGITITGLIISMTAATAKTFAGGSGSFSTLNQGGAGALTISGNNSFSDLTATTRPSTVTFTASSTQTFADFTLSGVLGSLVTINSSIAATRATLSKSSGTVSVGFLSIRDSNATGGAEWYAGTTSTNVSNNLGWIFTAPPGGAYAGNFFAFF